MQRKVNILIGAGFSVLLFLVIFMVLAGVGELNDSNNELNKIINNSFATVVIANEMRFLIRNEAVFVRNMLLNPQSKDQELSKIYDSRNKYQDLWQKFVSLNNNAIHGEKSVLIRKSAEKEKRTRLLWDKLIRNEVDNSYTFLVEQVRPVQWEWLNALDAIEKLETMTVMTDYQKATKMYRNAKIRLVAIGTAAVLISIVISLLVVASISTPLKAEIKARTFDLETTNNRLERALDELRETKLFAETVAQGIEEEILLLSKDYEILWANTTALKNFAGKPDRMIGKHCYQISHHREEPCDPSHCRCPLNECIRTGKHELFTHFHIDSNNAPAYIEIAAYAIKNEEGEIDKFVHLSKNITERVIIEEKLKTSLAEKEVLLREIHHRSKNNMNILSSLLQLQAYSVEDPQMLGVLRECQNRIKAMSLVHESLYKSQDLGRLDFCEYVKLIVDGLQASYSRDKNAIDIMVDIQDIYLNIHAAIPCGLVVNELLTNSFKYAFPDSLSNNPKPEIKITARRLNERIHLQVCDNGVGFPVGFDFMKIETMGLLIVKNIIENQLKGCIERIDNGGAGLKITFNADDWETACQDDTPGSLHAG